MSTSRTCHSNFLLESSHSSSLSSSQSFTDKSDDYDYIDDDYSTSPTTKITDPLIKCYHRHIREHISSMLTRYKHLSQTNITQIQSTNISSLIIESKAFAVAGHKLIFVLETLHEHLRHPTKTQQISTPLNNLTRQLVDVLTTFVRLLKQLSHEHCTNNSQLMNNFQHDTQLMMNIVKKIKRQCNSM
jgi:hypothetical protein